MTLYVTVFLIESYTVHFQVPYMRFSSVSILIHLIVLFREESKTQHHNGPDPQLSQESSQAWMSGDQGVEHLPRKIFENATESVAWAGATVH